MTIYNFENELFYALFALFLQMCFHKWDIPGKFDLKGFKIKNTYLTWCDWCFRFWCIILVKLVYTGFCLSFGIQFLVSAGVASFIAHLIEKIAYYVEN